MSRPGPWLVLLAVLAGLGGAGTARAQQFDTVELNELRGFVEVGFRARDENRSNNGVDAGSDGDEVRFQELLHLDAAGHVYHPGLLVYRGSADVMLFQELADDQSDTLRGGGWDLLFLNGKPFSFSLYGDVRETEIERLFFRSSRQESTLYGATARLNVQPLPLELSWVRRSSERPSVSATGDQTTEELTARTRYALGTWSNGDVEYRITDEEVGQLEVSRRRLLATNTTYLDPEGRKRLLFNFFHGEQDDGRERTTTSGFGNFSWRHSSRLSTEYRVDFQQTESDIQTTDRLNLEAALRHQLFDSLVSRVEGYARLHDSSFGSTETFGLRVNEDYTKRLGWWGRLDIDLAPWVEVVRSRPDQETAATIGEMRVLNGTNRIELGQRSIDPASIVVTDSSGLITYVDGLDYLLTTVGDVTELERLVTGSIADGESVLVDYVYRLTGPSDLLTQGVSLYTAISIRDSMAIYGKLRYRTERRLSGDPDRQLDTRRTELLGLKLTRRWMTATTEFERDHSTSRTTDTFTQSLLFSTPTRGRWSASLNTTARVQSFDDFDGLLSRLSTSALLRADIARRGRLVVEMDYRKEDWSGATGEGFQDMYGYGAKARFSWYFGRSSLSVEGSISRLDREGQLEELDRILVSLRREF